MPLDINSLFDAHIALKKDLYEMGEMPPLGYVPKKMYAWAIRRERHGEPNTAMIQEILEVPRLDNYDVLVHRRFLQCVSQTKLSLNSNDKRMCFILRADFGGIKLEWGGGLIAINRFYCYRYAACYECYQRFDYLWVDHNC